MLERELDRLLSKIVDGGCAGNGLEVCRNGEVLYRKAFGMADLERDLKMQPETLFRAYSITKPIISAAALTFHEKGAFGLDTPLYEILPEFRDMGVCETDPRGDTALVPAREPILMKHVLNQTAGFTGAGYADISICGQYHKKQLDALREKTGGNYSLSEYVGTVAASPLAFQPGTHFHYGNGYEVLARVLEVLSGLPLSECLKNTVFQPLGMEETSFRTDRETFYGKTAKYYDLKDGRPVLNTARDRYFLPDARFESGSGGLLTTLDDYTRFGQALVCGAVHGVRLLKDETINLMRSNSLEKEALYDFEMRYRQHGTDFTGYGYGFGVRTLMDPEKAKSNSNAGEFGWYGMTGAFSLFDPKEKLSVVYNHQTMPYDSKAIHWAIRDAVYANL